MKKLLILCMTFLCILTGCGNTDSAKNTEQNSSYQQVSMEEGLELMKEDSGYILLDVRRDDEFEEGHIPGAINIPNESIGTEEIAELPDKRQAIYVYCRSGNRSKQASQKLVDLGYTNVIEFGGIIDYSGELEKAYKIMYLSVDNIREAEEKIKKERSDESGNEMWFPVMIKYLEEAPYSKVHGYMGMEGLVKHLEHRTDLEKRILREIFDGHHIIYERKLEENTNLGMNIKL